LDVFEVNPLFVFASILNFIAFIGIVLAVVWAIRRLRQIGSLERRIDELEARVEEMDEGARTG
jgi:flagellar biogenesis protein FliO